MIKRTLHFGNPVYLSLKNDQILVRYPDEPEQVSIAKRLKEPSESYTKTVAIEDVAVMVLESKHITITTSLMERLMQNKVAVITCDDRHMPVGLLQPMEGHSEQSERFRLQVNASEPLKKNLWQQTVQAKIINQAKHLEERTGMSVNNMFYWAKEVKSGDAKNHEAQSAAYYWKHIFDVYGFSRFRSGIPPNNLLNYGYAILRAITARALISSGLFPTFGIYHHNKYNAYCLADDIMEPYRPYVDFVVGHLLDYEDDISELTIHLKKELLQIPALDVVIDGKKSPLLVAMSRTTNSLYECYAGVSRKLIYPVYE